MIKISVIVPIYNVEEYLDECIKSIVNQSYKNLEIILVNDGSKDRSLFICNKYQCEDERIRIISKENGGLSDARNAGLSVATGDYISFIDGDDYLELDMYKFLVDKIQKYNADIAICGLYRSEEDYRDKMTRKVELTFNSEQALATMFKETYFNTSACDKLFKRELFSSIKFPVGKIYEDLFTIYKVIDSASCIVYNSDPKYFYRITDGSITNCKFSEKNLDFLQATEEILCFLQEYYPNIIPTMKNRLTRYSTSFLRLIIKSNYENNSVILRLQKNIKSNLYSYIKSDYKLASKLFAIGVSISFPMVKSFYNITKRVSKS
ncbi:putative glycosyltransferase EpsJ [Clostridium paraputrificum]|uniref:glycosyltransferase family 2 protein n=1 Tax=Clostridium paraputrificum TaxID=29363 RepID=UPI0006C0E166|nr:glycosyltransferase family 2 protein [Clostridium paraputrificum]CUQ42747.1 putative glycosyltransferase EpsJ [Clostridium paraputrificum]